MVQSKTGRGEGEGRGGGPDGGAVGELRRGAERIISNYVRLGVAVLCGILYVPILVGGVGVEGFGLWGLVGATVGIASILREVIASSLIRELGTAWHDRESGGFPGILDSAQAVALGVALISVGLFGLIGLALPLLVPPDLIVPARWVLVGEATATAAMIGTAPIFNMYPVTERFGLYNVWMSLDRATFLIVAVAVFLIAGVDNPGTGLIAFGLGSGWTRAAIFLLASAIMMVQEPLVRPRVWLANRRAIRQILPTAGRIGLVTAAVNSQMRIGQILMAYFFGMWGSGVFSVGLRLASYARMITKGMSDGLDAVFVRISGEAPRDPAGNGGDARIRAITRVSTQLHAIVAFPAAGLVLLLAEPLIEQWVGQGIRIGDAKGLSESDTHLAAAVTRLLVIGTLARSIGDGWIRMIYGSGRIRSIVRWVLAALMLNPVLALLIVWMLPSYSEGVFLTDFAGPSFGYAIPVVLLNAAVLPIVLAGLFHLRVSDLLQPCVRPAFAAAAASVVLIGSLLAIGDRWTLPALGGICALYAITYALAAWRIAINAGMRRALRRGVSRSAEALRPGTLLNRSRRRRDAGSIPISRAPDESS